MYQTGGSLTGNTSSNIERHTAKNLYWCFSCHRADCSSQGGFENDTVRSTCYLSPSERIGIYTLTTMTSVLLNFGRAILFYFVCLRASYILHNRMFSSVLRTFVQFFDNNPAGTISISMSLNRLPYMPPLLSISHMQVEF